MSVHFKHPQLEHEVESIAGVYAYTHEKRLSVDDKEILCFIGYAIANKSCCGVGGCMFATIAGFLQEYAVQKEGDSVISMVEPVSDTSTRQRIEAMLRLEGIQQVQFYAA